MIITHITSVHPRYDTRIFIKECTSLARFGYFVNLVVADGKGDECKNEVRILDVGADKGNRFKRMTRTVGRVYERAVATNADIYHLHDPELLTLVPRLMKRGRLVYDVHEDLPRQILTKYWIPRLFRPIFAALFERIENHYAKQVSKIIGATPFITERFERMHKNTCNINNYPISEEFEDIGHIATNETVICYIGEISSFRGIYEIVQAMKDIDGKLLLAGVFSNPNERKIATSLPGWEKVIEFGYCDRKKIKKILNQSNAGLVILHPTINYIDALPVKLFEYMAAGLPVIASDFPLWRQIVNSAQCGICVDPLDISAITKAIKWLINNANDANAMRIAGRKAVLERYNWRCEETKLLESYNRLLQENS